MYTALEFIFQCLVDEAMAGNQDFVLEIVAYYNDLEMGFRAFRHIMQVTFVNDFEMFGGQCLLEFIDDCLLHVH